MHVRHDNWFKIKGEDEFFALRKTCPLFSCETREREKENRLRYEVNLGFNLGDKAYDYDL
jgi:hypothetical protein